MSSTSRPSPHPITHPKILRHIIPYAAESTLVVAPRVHSDWYHLAIPLLYRDIILDLNAQAHAFAGALGQSTPTSKMELAEGRKVEALKHTEVLRIYNQTHNEPTEGWAQRPVPLPIVKTIFLKAKAGQMCNMVDCPCYSLAKPAEIIRITTSYRIAIDDIWSRLPQHRLSKRTLLVSLPPHGAEVNHEGEFQHYLGMRPLQVGAKLDGLVIRVQRCRKLFYVLDKDHFYRLGLVGLAACNFSGQCTIIDDDGFFDSIIRTQVMRMTALSERYSLLTGRSHRVRRMTSKEYMASEGAVGGSGTDEWEKWLEE